MSDATLYVIREQGEEVARLFERTIELTMEMARLQWHYTKLVPLSRACVVFNGAGLALFVISWFEQGQFNTPWKLGVICCMVAWGLLGQLIWTRRRLYRRGRRIVEEMEQITARLAELKQ